MEDLTVAYVTLGVGVVLLAALLLAARGHARRFTRENTALRADVAARVAVLRALVNSRRPGGEGRDVAGSRYTRTA